MSDSHVLRVALAQVASSRVPAENRQRLTGLRPGADLVVLPEATACDFGGPDDPVAPFAEPLDGPFVTTLIECARRQGGTWVAGMFECGEDLGRPFNTLVVVDSGGLRATYRKIHLYDSFGYRESDRLAAPQPRPTTVVVGDLTVGLMTCYDLRFPELGRALARAGAELLLVPAAWVAGPRKVRHWEVLVTARAIEDVAYVAAAGQPGPRYTGHSMLVDPRGEVVASAGSDERLVLGEVSLDVLRQTREENPSLGNRRDEVAWPPAARL
jgi:predicted amidohydrolase